MKKTLLVIIPDLLSALVAKGEITSRYYNPGDLFDEVHLLMTNSDRPDPAAVQKTVGRARLHLHNLPLPSYPGTLGWRPIFLRGWLQTGIRLAREISPALIRTHGCFQNGFLAAQIKKHLGLPLVVSLHTYPDVDLQDRIPLWTRLKRRLTFEVMRKFETETLQTADWVLPVYESIRKYAERLGANHIEVCYNVINPDNLLKKGYYSLNRPPRIVSVSRQIPGKNQSNLIRALVRLPEARLTLVGDGPYHQHLQQEAIAAGVSARTDFLQAVPNDQLCRMLPEFDIFATHTEYWELSKAVLEALLTGLPVVLNRRRGEPVPELQGDFLLLAENTPEDYSQALQKLLTDHEFREQLGRKAYAHAQEHWAPAKTEAKFVEIYRQLTSIS